MIEVVTVNPKVGLSCGGDVNAEFARLKALGVRFTQDPRDVANEPVSSAVALYSFAEHRE